MATLKSGRWRRREDIALLVGVIAWGSLTISGGLVFCYFVRDTEWRALFGSVLWLPTGAVALWLKNHIERRLLRAR